MPLSAGTKLGPYEIVSQLGAGGMGEVYRANDARLGRDVAIKVLPSHLCNDAELKQRFEREARAIAALDHPNICGIYDIGKQDGVEFLVLEYIDGESLAQRIARGPVHLDQLLKIAADIAEGLDKAHRAGIVHRDLKPGNIMLTKDGAKLLDFGLAKPSALGAAAGSGSAPLLSAAVTVANAASPLTTRGSIVGTVQYMSPEQIEGKPADARSDIFAFGGVLYEMATGKHFLYLATNHNGGNAAENGIYFGSLDGKENHALLFPKSTEGSRGIPAHNSFKSRDPRDRGRGGTPTCSRRAASYFPEQDAAPRPAQDRGLRHHR